MRKTSQTRSAGPTRVKGVGDAILRGTTERKEKGGVEKKGTETYDSRSLTFRRLNNADPTSKI